MRSVHDLATALHQFFKELVPRSDEELAEAYLDDSGDLIDLEMRMRELDRRRSYHS